MTALYFSIINVLCGAGGDASFAPQANLFKSPPTMWWRLIVLVLSIVVINIIIIILFQQFDDVNASSRQFLSDLHENFSEHPLMDYPA